MTDLKPCPFCGADAKMYTAREESYGYYCATRAVRCTKCWLRGPAFNTQEWEQGKGTYDIDAETPAAEAWNTRADVSPWISVEDRLPNEGDLVIVKSESVWVVFWSEGDWWSSDSGAALNKDAVTHWMPVPPLETNRGSEW